MAGPSIGDVAVEVTGDASGLGDSFTRDINGRLQDAQGKFVKEASKLGLGGGQAASTGFMSRFGSRLGTDLKTVGAASMRAVGGVMQAGAAAVGGVVATGIGTAFTKGFARLNAIDQAQAKLKGLGNTTGEVAEIMRNSLEAVDGTAFGLGEAATTAAGAVAAGIKPGSELSAILKTTANTAAAAGTSMEEMGGIFNRVAANGKASNAELQQLADRGVPIYAKLAEQLGVSQEEVFKLASAGKISFQQFSDAAAAASGKVAKEMGTTVQGSFANLQASLGRIGANILGPVFQTLPGLFINITKAMKPLEGQAEKLGVALGGAFTDGIAKITELAEVVKPLWKGLSGGTQAGIILAGVSAAMVALGQAVAPLLGPFGRLIPTFSGVAGAARIFMGPIGLIITALTLAYQNSEPFREALSALGAQLLSVGQDAAGTLAPALGVLPGLFASLNSIMSSVGAVIGSLLAAILPLVGTLIGALVPVVTQLISSVLPPLAEAFGLIGQALALLAPHFAGFYQMIAGVLLPVIQAILPVVSAVFGMVANVIGAVLQVVIGILNVFIGVFTGDWDRAWNGLVGIVQGVWNLIASLAEGWTNIMKAILTGAWSLITAGAQAAWGGIQAFIAASITLVTSIVTSQVNAVKGVVTTVWNAIKTTNQIIWNAIRNTINTVVNTVRTIVTNTFNTIRATITNVLNSVRSTVTGTFNNIRSTITSSVNSARSTVTSTFNTIKTTMTNAVNSAKSSVTAAFNGIVSAITGAISRAVAAVQGLGSSISATVSGFGSLLYSAGQNIIQGLINGIGSMIGNVTGAVSNVLGAARNLLPFSPAKEGPFSGRGWTEYSGQAIFRDFAKGIDKTGPLAVTATQRVVGEAARPLSRLGAPVAGQGATTAAAPVASDQGNIAIAQNFYGPTTSGGRLRELDWTARYATKARSYQSAGMATA